MTSSTAGAASHRDSSSSSRSESRGMAESVEPGSVRAACRRPPSGRVRRARAARSRGFRRPGPSRAGVYSRSAGVPGTVSSTSSVFPQSRASTSAASISFAPSPRRRARGWTSSLARSARCGWLSGCSMTSWTVPRDALVVLGHEQRSLAGLHSCGDAAPERVRPGRRQRMHEADRRPRRRSRRAGRPARRPAPRRSRGAAG